MHRGVNREQLRRAAMLLAEAPLRDGVDLARGRHRPVGSILILDPPVAVLPPCPVFRRRRPCVDEQLIFGGGRNPCTVDRGKATGLSEELRLEQRPHQHSIGVLAFPATVCAKLVDVFRNLGSPFLNRLQQGVAIGPRLTVELTDRVHCTGRRDR